MQAGKLQHKGPAAKPIEAAGKRMKKAAADLEKAAGPVETGPVPYDTSWIDKVSTPAIPTPAVDPNPDHAPPAREGTLLTSIEAPHLIITVNINIPNLDAAIRGCFAAVAAAGELLRQDLVTR